MNDHVEHIFKLAYYRKEDWTKFQNSVDDRNELDDTWEEWLTNFVALKTTLEIEGKEVLAVTIDIDKLVEYCRKNKLKNTRRNRASYAASL